MRFLKNPKNNNPDPLFTLTVVVVLVAALKFLFEGVSFTVMGNTMNLGHADALTYGALLTPVLGAHGFMSTKTEDKAPAQEDSKNAQ